MSMVLLQALGLGIALMAVHLAPLYLGFLIYGVGLGGSWVLQEVVWAHCYGRMSLGTVRELGILLPHGFGAAGNPFFGFVHDVTDSYVSSFFGGRRLDGDG